MKKILWFLILFMPFIYGMENRKRKSSKPKAQKKELKFISITVEEDEIQKRRKLISIPQENDATQNNLQFVDETRENDATREELSREVVILNNILKVKELLEEKVNPDINIKLPGLPAKPLVIHAIKEGFIDAAKLPISAGASIEPESTATAEDSELECYELFNANSLPSEIHNKLLTEISSADISSIEDMKKILRSIGGLSAKMIHELILRCLEERNATTIKKIEFLLTYNQVPTNIKLEEFIVPIDVNDERNRFFIELFKKHPIYSQYIKFLCRKKKLIYAVEENHPALLSKLLTRGGDPNTLHHNTPLLIIALNNDNNEIAKLLISHGADIFKSDAQFISPLQTARDRQNTEMLNILQELYNDKEKKLASNPQFLRNKSLLFEAIKKQDVEMVKGLISVYKELIDMKDNSGITPLIYAIIYKSNEIARALLYQNANPNLGDAVGWTPLHWAVINNDLEMVKLLLLSRAAINERDKGNSTPLSHSLNNKCKKITNLLLRNGATL